MTTLKDIAKVAGVSISTVSRALNNNPSISAGTRKLIQEIAQKMNYRSDKPVLSTDSSQKKAIAVIVPYITIPFFSTLVSGIQDAAIMNQYSMMLFSTEMDIASEKKVIDFILSMDNVAGVIIAPPETEQTYCQPLHDAMIPVVYVGYKPLSLESPATVIIPDDFVGAKIATEYLISCGMKSIVLFTGPAQTQAARNRADGYFDVIKRFNLTPSIFSGPFTYHAALQKGLEMFGQPGKLMVDAVIAGTDMQAIGIMHALEKNDLRIPDDVSLISFEDTFLTSLCSPQLTSVSLSIYSMGTKSVSALIERIEKDTSSDSIQLIKPVLMKRMSCNNKKVQNRDE